MFHALVRAAVVIWEVRLLGLVVKLDRMTERVPQRHDQVARLVHAFCDAAHNVVRKKLSRFSCIIAALINVVCARIVFHVLVGTVARFLTMYCMQF